VTCRLCRAAAWLRSWRGILDPTPPMPGPWPPVDDLVSRLLLAEARLEAAEAEVARLRKQLERRGRSA